LVRTYKKESGKEKSGNREEARTLESQPKKQKEGQKVASQVHTREP